MEEKLLKLNGLCENIIREGLNVKKDLDNDMVKEYHKLNEEINIYYKLEG